MTNRDDKVLFHLESLEPRVLLSGEALVDLPVTELATESASPMQIAYTNYLVILSTILE